jgi:hypothetical protein
VLCSILMLPVFYLLARRLLGSWFPAVLALGAFALLPRSFEWFITGGGITRAPGYVLALVATYAMVLGLDTGHRRYVAGAALAAGLAILTHPNAAAVTVVSLVMLAAFRRPWRRSWATLAVVLAGAAVVSAPWWLVDLLRFGVAPLVSAAGSGSQIGPLTGVYRLITFDFAEEPFLPWITGLAAVGLAWSLARRRFLVPAWLAAILLLDPNAAPTDATIPLAMLAAVGLVQVVLPALAGAVDGGRARTGPDLLRTRPVRLTLLTVLGLAFLGALFRPIQDGSPDHVLPADVRSAMTWVAARTPAQATFVVITGRVWYSDDVSEWFPELTDRTSVATVQGYEWLGGQRWWRQQGANDDLQACAVAANACLTAWMHKYGVTPTYVFLPKGRIGGPLSAADCCAALRQTLTASPDYIVAYDGPGATILKLRAPPAASGERGGAPVQN